MHVIRRRGWEIPERLATPEHLFFSRRQVLAAAGAAAVALAPRLALAQRIADLPDPSARSPRSGSISTTTISTNSAPPS